MVRTKTDRQKKQTHTQQEPYSSWLGTAGVLVELESLARSASDAWWAPPSTCKTVAESVFWMASVAFLGSDEEGVDLGVSEGQGAWVEGLSLRSTSGASAGGEGGVVKLHLVVQD